MIHEKMNELGRFWRRGSRRRTAPPGRRRLLLESLEDRRMLAANITVTDAFLRDGIGLRTAAPVLGEQLEVQVNFRTTDLFATSAYRIDVSIDGVMLNSGIITAGAGVASGTFLQRVSGWYAEAGEHTVDVVVDGGSNVSESNELDNAFSFKFTPQRTTLPSKFIWPETDTPYQDHLLNNYVDLDPTIGIRDWQGGTASRNAHRGIDLGAANFAGLDAGRSVVAVADGMVVAAVDGNPDRSTVLSGLPSNLVTVDHGNGWQTTYAHLRRDSVRVKVGDTVQQGDLLALEGSSGNSTASHLHFEVQHNGRPVETFLDPNTFWENPIGYVGDEPFLVDSGITNYNPVRHLAERPSNVAVISQASGQASFGWGTFSGLRQGDFLEFTWVQPNGVVHARRGATINQDAASSTLVFSTNLPATPALGVWTIDIRNNNRLLGRKTFEVTTQGAPEIRIDDLSGEIMLDERYSPVDFGTVAQKSPPPSNRFTVVNHGTDTLVLSGLVVPRGFLILDGLGTALAPGAQDTFTVALNTSDAGYYGGQIRVFSNDSDEAVYNVSIEGIVTSQATGTMRLGIGKRTIAESGSTIANVTRSGNLGAPLRVDLVNNRPTQAVIPNSVVIPAGQRSATFTIRGINDGLEDGVQVVEFTATAPGFANASNTLNVADVPTILVNIEKDEVSEADGLGASKISIARLGGDLTKSLDIVLEVNDLTEAKVPLLVTMVPFQSIANVSLEAVDDDILDGPRTVTLTASAAGFETGVDTVVVLDHETVALTLNATTIPENGGAISGRVTRSNSDNQAPLVVQLRSDDPSEATVASQVTIPGGQASIPFTLTAVDDDLLDGDQLVTITSSAPAYIDGSAKILVTDSETLTLKIVASAISEFNGTTTATVTRSNSDIGSPLRVSLNSNDTTEAVVPAFIDIPANKSSVSFPILAVDDNLLDGNHTVIVTATAAGYRSGLDALLVIDHETLSVSFEQTSIFEDGGATIGTVTRNNTNVNLPITVALTSSNTNEARVPPVVQIPANQASANFVVTSVDDFVADGDQTVEIRAVAGGYNAAAATLTVSDQPGLSITSSATVVSENAAATQLTLRRHNTDKTQPLPVVLRNSLPTQATVPTSVEIPANADSVTFDFVPIDDTLLDGTHTVTVMASVTGLASASTAITVEDHETLTLSLASTSFAENSSGTTATITRSNTDNQLPLQVFLQGNDPTEATTLTSVTIPANAASFQFPITAVDDTLLDGAQTVTFVASANGYQSGSAVVEVLDHERLTLTLSAGTMSERGGSVTGTVTRSNSDLAGSVLVELFSDDTSEATVMANVRILAQRSSATFTITGVDDDLLDGTVRAAITAKSAGYVDGSVSLDVTDHEAISVVLNDSSISESGGMTTGTVTRGNTDIGSSLTVQLRTSDASEATLPVSTVVIPANVASAAFQVDAANDTIFDGDQVVTISATAAGYVEGKALLTVTDHENLVLNLAANTISEHLGSTEATVSRSNTNLLSAITVTVVTDLPGRTSVAKTVVIKAGKTTSSPFLVSAIDNHLLDGPATATISVAATGYQGDMQSLTVLDNETLTLKIRNSQISENGGQTTGTVRRNNVDIGQELIVTLAGNNPQKAIVPTVVVIPAGQAQSPPFDIFAVDDNVFDGTQTVTISANASGYQPASTSLQVTDQEILTVSIDATSMSELNGVATGTVTRLNTDIGQSLLVNLAGSDDTEATVPATVLIPANATSQTFTITARDDALLDGTQSFAVTASADGYASATATIDVTDFETLSAALAQTSISEMGGATTITITRNNLDIGQPLTVTLVSNDPSEVTFGNNNIVIPANAKSVTVSLQAVDDALLDGTQRVALTVSAAGYVGATALLDVTDHETLGLTIDDAVISELGGSTVATITRSNVTDNGPLTVSITSQGQLPGGGVDLNPPTVPATVQFQAGQTSVSFPITAVDDDLLLGQRTAVIVASATGFETATAPLAIDDFETLSVTFDPTIKEGETKTGTVTRDNSNLGSAVVVTITSRHPTRLDVAPSVTIPIGQASTTFNVTAVNDGMDTGNLTVNVDLTAVGYQPSSFAVEVEEGASRWQNPVLHADVNNDGSVSPTDVLVMVNDINRNGARRLPTTGPTGPPPFLDVNGDGFITTNDIVIAINEINRGPDPEGGEGEFVVERVQDASTLTGLELLGSALRSTEVEGIAIPRWSVTTGLLPVSRSAEVLRHGVVYDGAVRGDAALDEGIDLLPSTVRDASDTEELESLLEMLAADVALQSGDSRSM